MTFNFLYQKVSNYYINIIKKGIMYRRFNQAENTHKFTEMYSQRIIKRLKFLEVSLMQ